MTVERIVERIIEDAQKEASSIVEEAKQRAAALQEEAEKEAAALRENLLAAASAEAEAYERRTQAQIELEKKKTFSALAAASLEEVYQRAEEKFFALPRQQLEEVLTALIASVEWAGNEEIVFSETFKKLRSRAFVERVNAKLGTHFRLGEGECEAGTLELRGRDYRTIVSLRQLFLAEKASLEKEILKLLEGNR